MDYEVLIESVIAEHQQANKSLWKCAEYVGRLYAEYGVYERDFTAALVTGLGVQADTLYHWRKAWELLQTVLEAFPKFELGGLSISHFYHAADYVDRMGVEWVYDWLVVARESGFSSRRLAAEMGTACDDSGTAGWLYTRLDRVYQRLGKLYSSAEQAGLPEHKRRRLRRVCLLLADIVKAK